MPLQNKRILLGISGSIAAYKAVILLRLLKKAGASVKVITTPSVSQFVGELSLSSLSGESVFSGLWSENWSEHVALGTSSDLMLIAPATANTIAKLAHGLCDNALTAVYLAARCPVMLAPAMDADMYIHPRTAANLKQLESDGVKVLPVGTGFLASGLEGPGRLLEPEEIFNAVQDFFKQKQILAGKKILVSAGPTLERIDPVRFISNHSSGKMGYAIAQKAAEFGAEVRLVSGPTHLSAPECVALTSVESAQEMYETIHSQAADMNAIIMAAAVADYRPAHIADQKIKKKDGDEHSIRLSRTKDILKSLGQIKPKGQILVGFAMETQNELENAQKKLHSKKLDFVVLNSLKEKGAGFGHDTNVVTFLDRNDQIEALPLMKKVEVAEKILEKVASLMGIHPL